MLVERAYFSIASRRDPTRLNHIGSTWSNIVDGLTIILAVRRPTRNGFCCSVCMVMRSMLSRMPKMVPFASWALDRTWPMATRPWSRYYLFTAFSEHNSTDNTFDDILRALVPRLRYMFDETNFNWCHAGWKWTYSSTQGDLRFITDRYGLHNFRKNRICDLCGCVKKDDNIAMTLADFRETAAYRATHYTNQDYLQSTTPETRIQDALVPTICMFCLNILYTI